MKILHLVIMSSVLLLLGIGLSKQNAHAENPPVIITQVELGSPLVLLPDTQPCTSPPDPKSTNNCLTDSVSGHNMACSYFLGSSTCEPLHHWTSGTNQSCMKGYPQGGAPQWFDMYNTSGMIVDLQNFTVFNKLNLKPYGSMGPFSTTLELRPHEKCTFSWLPMDQALYMGLNNMSMTISYNYNGKYYNASTPSLSDTYNDTRTWQLDNNKWIFAQNGAGIGNQLPIDTPFKSTLDLPLKQFKSGTPASDVKCNDGLQLILKREYNSPSCVTSHTANKLIQRGWGLMAISSSKQVYIVPNTNVCGQFYAAPIGHDSKTVPILLMNSNSTACARLTFTIFSNYKDCNGKICQSVIAFDSLHIGNLHYEKHDNMFSVSAGKDYTSSFNITTLPGEIDLANYPIGANFTVTYVIKSLPNATGFYDQSIPKLACERYPLAVGYTANQVNASNFSYIDPLNPPCGYGYTHLLELKFLK